MSDTIFNDDETLLKHFVCDCGEIQHGMMAMLEEGSVIFNWYVTPLGFWRRLRHSFEILIGRDDSYTEFILRKEDLGALIELLGVAEREKPK